MAKVAGKDNLCEVVGCESTVEVHCMVCGHSFCMEHVKQGDSFACATGYYHVKHDAGGYIVESLVGDSCSMYTTGAEHLCLDGTSTLLDGTTF